MVTCYPPRIDPWNHNNIIDVQYANCIRVWSLERRSLQERGRERVHGEGGSICIMYRTCHNICNYYMGNLARGEQVILFLH